MGDYKRPKKWNERTSCFETEFTIFNHVLNQDITEMEAKGIVYMLCREWFGEKKGQIINLILDLKDAGQG